MRCASASCSSVSCSSVSGSVIGAFAAFSVYVAPVTATSILPRLAAVSEAGSSAAHTAPLPSRNAAVPSAIDFFYVIM